jgi:mannose-6-phosphate isomerase-like protein (cupin superfamily)
MLVSRDDSPEIADASNAVVMRQLVRATAHGSDVSMTWVRLQGRHRRLRSDRSTRLYYVLEGEATFVLGDGQPFRAGQDDVVVVPAATPYEFWGEMTYLVVNGPAFVEGDDVYED